MRLTISPNSALMGFHVVAITGNVGCGKSAVAQELIELGAIVIDADELARKAVEPDSTALGKISEAFGQEVLMSDGTLNRSLVAEIIFSDSIKRQALEAIVHPEVQRLFRERLKELQRANKDLPSLAFYIVPLLFEAKLDLSQFWKIIVASAPENLCIERLVERRAWSVEQAKLCLSTQMPVSEKEKRADYVIYNTGTLEELRKKVSDLYQELIASFKLNREKLKK